MTGSCENETVQLAWMEAGGAVHYIATASGDLGYVTSFITNDTVLEAELLCGQSYAFTVRAQGHVCDSVPSVAAFFTTGTPRGVPAVFNPPHAGGRSRDIKMQVDTCAPSNEPCVFIIRRADSHDKAQKLLKKNHSVVDNGLIY